MEQSDLLRFIVSVMERLGIRYFVTGSVVTVFYGEPRFTNDIDIVADLHAGKVKDFCSSFPETAYYLSEDAVRQAVALRGQFNIIHPASGLKVDIMLPGDTVYDRGRFVRAVRVRPEVDYEAAFSSIEDVILKKMEFHQSGGSEKHLRDIASVLKISGSRIDRTYIEEWALRLGVAETWRKIASGAGPAE